MYPSPNANQSIQYTGDRLKHSTSNDWQWTPTKGAIDPRGPFDIALLGVNREVLRVRIGQLRSQDIGIQFAVPTGPVPAGAAAAPSVEPKVQTPPVTAAAAPRRP
jgi:hypothetical protein